MVIVKEGLDPRNYSFLPSPASFFAISSTILGRSSASTLSTMLAIALGSVGAGMELEAAAGALSAAAAAAMAAGSATAGGAGSKFSRAGSDFGVSLEPAAGDFRIILNPK